MVGRAKKGELICEHTTFGEMPGEAERESMNGEPTWPWACKGVLIGESCGSGRHDNMVNEW